LETVLNTAQLLGLLIPIHDSGEIMSIISCDEEIAKEIMISKKIIHFYKKQVSIQI